MDHVRFSPCPPVPPIFGLTQYPGGIVHAVQDDFRYETICGCNIQSYHRKVPGDITCQDCLYDLANGAGRA
jgi:hypothetical protein